MKLLVSAEEREIGEELNGLELFSLYTVVTGSVIDQQFIRPKERCTLSAFLAEHRVDVLLCSGISPLVSSTLEAAGIVVHTQTGRDPGQAVAHYLEHQLDALAPVESAGGECLGNCATCAHPCR